MEVWVWYAAVLPVWLVYGEVNHHATAHKVLQQKLPCKSDVFLKGKFILQAEEYIDSIYRGNKLNCKPKIKAYVVGDSVSPAIGTHKTLENYGEVYVYTYAQLVQTASKRLFNLKNKLIERYQEMNAKDYISEILNEPKQTELVLL